MILGIGHDAVAIARFAHWHTYSHKKLQRIFSEHEIRYCVQTPLKSAERFAARFAAKEALYKALCQIGTGTTRPFLTLCAQSELVPSPQGPQIKTTYPLQGTISVSITHTDTYAYAIVVIHLPPKLA